MIGSRLDGYILGHMPRYKVPFYTKLDPELREALRRYKAAVGVPEAVQIDRALREWLADRPEAWALPKGETKTERRRGQTRRRP